jgi:Fe2+ or Zn2+ uptake regulation protein
MRRDDIDQLAAACAERLRQRGMRRTRALDLLIREMAKRDRPVTIAELTRTDALRSQCDPATVYRLLVKLEQLGLVRQLGLHERAMYFTLVRPGHHRDYLICTGCGSITDVDMDCPVRNLERKLEKSSGFRHVYHELEFYGICPACHKGREQLNRNTARRRGRTMRSRQGGPAGRNSIPCEGL